MPSHGRTSVDVRWIAQRFPELSDLVPLAQGGQKIVFSAVHENEGEVVLKLLLRESGFDRLEREILAAKLVACDRVPRIYATGSLSSPLGERIWVREERVHGETLRTSLRSGPLGFDDVLRLGVQLLDILVVAEAHRLVHRDIKPENVMVDPQGDFWLLDFGLARHLDLESLTATHHRYGVGTLGYSAPEQMRNRKREIDSRSDLFALGVVLYECTCGRNPFLDGARDGLEVLRRVERQHLPRLQHADDANGEFADFMAALTQKYPSQRPSSVKDAKLWIEEIMAIRSSSARPRS